MEYEFPKGVAKGANTILNIVYQSKIYILHVIIVLCKIKTIYHFFWFWFNNITVNFIISGYTKFICDAFFEQIKKNLSKLKS